MTRKEPTFTIGIEEEYLLVDRESRALVVDPPKRLMKECEARLKGRVSPEFLLSQIEVGTSKCTTLKEAAEEIRYRDHADDLAAFEHRHMPHLTGREDGVSAVTEIEVLGFG